jgi:hypothetical protein
MADSRTRSRLWNPTFLFAVLVLAVMAGLELYLLTQPSIDHLADLSLRR